MRQATFETVADGPRRSAVVEALEATRRGMRRFRRASTLVGLILLEIGLGSAVVGADVAWVLPVMVRAVGLAALGLVAVVGGCWLVFKPGGQFGRLDAAREVEQAFPELGQRVRTTLEYAEPSPQTAPALSTLVGALAADTERQSRGLEFPALVPWSAFRRKAGVLAVAVLILAVAVAGDANWRTGFQRLFLLPAHYTTLAVEPGDRTLKVGAPFALKATLTGRPVGSAHWLRRDAGSAKAWEAAALVPAPGTRTLIGVLEASRPDCQSSFEYKVVAGELESPVFRVNVTHPLVLKAIEARVEPPAYTRRPPSVATEGNFPALEGSNVRFQVTLDRPAKSARLAWAPAEGPDSKKRQMVALTIDGTTLRGNLPPLARDVRYEILAEAADGMALDPASYRIKVRADEKPSVRFIKPAESFAATPTTEVPVKVEAGDDYGVSRVGISYRIGDGPEESLLLDDPKGQPPTLEALATLYLEKHDIAFTDSLSYRAFVEDNHPGTPLRASTELRFIDILPYKQAYGMNDSPSPGGGGPPSGTSVTLEELIARQRQALNRTFAHVDDGSVEAAVADRLSQTEADLAFATEEFAKGLAARFGEVPPLQEATQQLQMATVALANKDVVGSIPIEQAALASLIRARQNLRKLLCTGSSASQCRKFDRQQDQKLRKPPTADKPQAAELAKLEQDIKKLADEQKKFADEIDPKGGGGAKFEKPDAPKPAPPNATPPKPGSGSKPSPADCQQAAAKEADRLKNLAKGDKALTDLARSRMDAAAQEVKEAATALGASKPAEAAESARTAAEQLDRLADQVAGLKSKDLAARLAGARDLAQATARTERELAGSGPASEPGAAVARQMGPIEAARTLADVLKKLRSDAAEEDRTLASALGKATETNAPSEIEAGMCRASTALATADQATSARELSEAAARLEALARDVEGARRAFAQPRLEQLLAAEKKAAEVERVLNTVAAAGQKPAADKALADLARTVEGLKPGDGPLRDAAAALTTAARDAGSSTWGPPRENKLQEGFFTPPAATTAAVHGISRALQAKIQEMIVHDALVDRDGAVPPGFKDRVDAYFRVLSEDLR